MQNQELHNLLQDGLTQLKLEVTSAAKSKLIDFITILDKWNKVHNLTSIKTTKAMVSHHLLDSVVAYPKIKDVKTVLDVGTGAGIPGIVLSVLMPEARFSLLDSNKKKLRFVQHVITCLKLGNVEVVDSRVEDFYPEERYQLVVSRAFSSLNNFLLTGSNVCKDKGLFLAYKGLPPDFVAEPLPEGFSLKEVENITVPGLAKQRCLVFVCNNPSSN